LGYASRRRMKREMTAKEYKEWEAFYQSNPWGERRADLRMGILAAATVSPWVHKGVTPRPADFMPKFGTDEDATNGGMSDSAMKGQLAAMRAKQKERRKQKMNRKKRDG